MNDQRRGMSQAGQEASRADYRATGEGRLWPLSVAWRFAEYDDGGPSAEEAAIEQSYHRQFNKLREAVHEHVAADELIKAREAVDRAFGITLTHLGYDSEAAEVLRQDIEAIVRKLLDGIAESLDRQVAGELPAKMITEAYSLQQKNELRVSDAAWKRIEHHIIQAADWALGFLWGNNPYRLVALESAVAFFSAIRPDPAKRVFYAEEYERSMRAQVQAGLDHRAVWQARWSEAFGDIGSVSKGGGKESGTADAFVERPFRLDADVSEGGALRQFRDAKGWSLDGLSEKVGSITGERRLDVAVLRAIEEGQRSVTFEDAVLLSATLDKPLTALMRGRGADRRAVLLRESEATAAATGAVVDADFRGDVRRELLDFIDVVTADSMLRAGKQGRGAVEAWVSAMRTEAGFRGALLRYLAYGVLLQDHRRGLVEAEQVCFKAGDDDRRQLDALYLRGRARWYGKKDERAAIDDLRIARDLARRFHRPEREAWACYYLARLGIEQPQLLPNQTPECLIDEVERIARSIGRPDLELLATRARMTYLMQRRRYDEAIRLGREILDHSQGWDREGVDRILGYLRTDLGVCLRALNEETARVEAERYYDQGIKSGRIGSYAGMCLYLKSDLYSDRMVDALHSAAEARGNEDERSRWLAKAELHRQEALKLARQALEALKPTGDDAALHKASIRELLLENQPIASPLTRRGVLQDYATRHQQLTQTFLGTAAIDGSERYSPQPNEIPLNRLQGFLEEYFTGVAAYVGHAPHSERVNIDDFLRPDTLLAVPWIVGSSLVVRVFRRDDKRAVASNAGWFTLDRYQPTARMMFRQLLRIKEPGLFLDLSDETLITLQQRLRTVDAIAVSEPGELPRHIVVVGPNENVDWVCPIEWLRTSAGFGARRTSLLEITRGALMYATSRKGPLRSVNTPIPSEWTVIATDQQAGGMTVYQRARQAFGDRARQVQADSSASITNLSEGVMVLAHSGPNWSIENFLQRADWTGVRSVVLLFCSSSQYSVSAGPFIDGVTLRIREALGNDSLVVAARMPVDIEDAIQLGEELQLPLHRGAPLPEVITQHLRNAQHYGIHAYQKPWVVLG